jgi:hypothetical protein
MSFKAMAWALLAAIALATVLLFNYWAAYQPLSTLVYSGIVLALCGLANLAVPFRFLGVHRRAVGALALAGGVALSYAALSWPASTIRVAQPRTRLDDVMPEYQFVERHSARAHARPERVMQAIRESSFGDMTSLATLLKIRAVFVHAPAHDTGSLQSKRILDSFAESGYLLANSEHEVVMLGAWNARAQRRPDVHTLHEFVDYREPGAVKVAFDFTVEEAGQGWSKVSTETRVLAADEATCRGMGRYWRLIAPGSGLLRLQWLDGIKKRAESMPPSAS